MKYAIPSSLNLNEKPIFTTNIDLWAEIHTALILQFSLLAELSIAKVPVKEMLVNLSPGLLAFKMGNPRITVRAEIHQALLSHFFLGPDLYIGKLSVKD